MSFSASSRWPGAGALGGPPAPRHPQEGAERQPLPGPGVRQLHGCSGSLGLAVRNRPSRAGRRPVLPDWSWLLCRAPGMDGSPTHGTSSPRSVGQVLPPRLRPERHRSAQPQVPEQWEDAGGCGRMLSAPSPSKPQGRTPAPVPNPGPPGAGNTAGMGRDSTW